MRLANPFEVPGRWWKGCLHVHTTGSDGQMAPEMLLEHYYSGGFDFVAITDHWRVTDRTALSRDDFLVLSGIETEAAGGPGSDLVIPQFPGRKPAKYHIVGIDVHEDVERRPDHTAQSTIDHIRRQGGLPIIAHPSWSGLNINDLYPLRDYLAIEVYTSAPERGIARGFSHPQWDDLLSHGVPTLAVASDDSHRPGFDSLRAWTMVKAPALTREAIVGALRAGHFYASTGPVIHDVTWQRTDATSDKPSGTIAVRTSPARSVAMVADATRGSRVAAGVLSTARRARRVRSDEDQVYEGLLEGDSVTGATFVLQGSERYARLQVEDHHGRVAWTNPLFVEPA
jgi:predicted metal-dependent phosphoesterase TrpH